MAHNKKLEVYKIDPWNQMNIHVHGRRYVVSEISSVEGEHTMDFSSRQELVHWAQNHFRPEKFDATAEECKEIISKIKNMKV